jgi:hypothetical protein
MVAGEEEMEDGIRKKGAHNGNAGYMMLNLDWIMEVAK